MRYLENYYSPFYINSNETPIQAKVSIIARLSDILKKHKRKKILLTALALFLLSITILFAGYSEAATNVIRNGSFDNGLNEWVLNPSLTALPTTLTWPLQGDAAKMNLCPPGFTTGTIISQNLNVAGIGGRTFTLSMKLTKNYQPPGNTIAVYLTYGDSASGQQRVKVLNPNNDAITSDTPVTGTYTFSNTAQMLNKIEIAKEVDNCSFQVDDIVLSYDETQIPIPTTASPKNPSSARQPVEAALTRSTRRRR